MSLITEIVGWILFAAGGACGVVAHTVDRRLQRWRRNDVVSLATAFVPLRWQRRFYTQEGHAIVGRLWRLTFAMYGLAIAGMLLVTVARSSR